MHQHKSLSDFKIIDGKKGEFEAVFAVLEVKDLDGDVTMKGAFEEGAEVRVSAYNHKSWDGVLPVGKGVIQEQGNQVTIKGRFFMDTEAGRDTFTVVKEMGDLQEWSYGYDTLEEERGTFKGKSANIIKKQKVYEVSPVILGAGIGTRTTAIKSLIEGDQETKQLNSTLFTYLRDAGREKFNATKERWVYVEDFDIDEKYAIYRIIDEGSEDKLMKVSFERESDGGVKLAQEETPVEVAYADASDTDQGTTKDKGGEPGKKNICEVCGTETTGDELLCPEHGGMKGQKRDSDNEIDAEANGTRLKEMSADEKSTPAGRKMLEVTGTLKQLYSDIYWTLNELGRERFRRHLYVEIYDVDVDADFVIFRCREEGESCLVKIEFQRDSDGNIELSEDEEEVEIKEEFITAKSRGGDSGELETETHGEKKATPFKSTPTSEDAWSGPGTIAAIPNDAGADILKQMFAWVDPKGDPDKKSSYKFPHHEWKNDKPGPANLKACTAGIGILNGGRGGANIPDADRKGVYNHLARHLKDGDKEPPELKAAPEPTGLKFSDHIDAVMTEIDDLTERAASVVTLRAEKGKKRLGDESYALLKELTARMESLKGLLEGADNNHDAEEMSTVDRAFLDEIARSLT